MTRTCYDEAYGVGIDTAISADYRLRMPYGENGARFYVLRPGSAGLAALLPVCLFILKGTKIGIANHGSHSLAVKDIFGTTVATVATGTRELLTLLDNTVNGVWVTRNTASTLGTALVHDRESLSIGIGSWIGNGINLRTYADTYLGYKGTKPASVYCQVSNSVVIGSELVAEPAFDSGVWPAGTTLLLEITSGSQIVGKGGRGGNGQSWPATVNPQDGAIGGDAIKTSVNTVIVNHGTISGGGGGGGGGRAISGGGGGGGGGGAGYIPQLGGIGGTPGGQPGQTSGIGTQAAGGSGSGQIGQAGGFGGGPGANGNPATGSGPQGGAGGAAGFAIKRLASVTVTKIVVGTINGPEGTF